MNNKKKFSLLRYIGLGNKKKPTLEQRKQNKFYVGTAEDNIKKNKQNKKKLLAQIK